MQTKKQNIKEDKCYKAVRGKQKCWKGNLLTWQNAEN